MAIRAPDGANKELDPVGPTVSYEVMKLCTGPVLTQYGTAILGT